MEYKPWNYKDIKELTEIKIGKIFKENIFDMEVNENFTPSCWLLILYI